MSNSDRKRLDRESFHAKTSQLDAQALRKILWNLYSRGTGVLRERIEDALEPSTARRGAQAPEIDGAALREETERFVELARAGAYLGGSREVTRRERSQWRITCKRLVGSATALVQRGDLEDGAPTLGTLIDLLVETSDDQYFRTDDPVAVARVVISEAAQTLWLGRLRQQGFAAFAQSAAAELIRWESAYGWTRFGDGPVAERETHLADVLAGLLRGQDAWEAFSDAYLAALDRLVVEPARESPRKRASFESYEEQQRRYAVADRALQLTAWHELLLQRLTLDEPERRLDRIAAHPALGGWEIEFMKARISRLRGDERQARTLIEACLNALPGHQEFIAFAREIGAKLPDRLGSR